MSGIEWNYTTWLNIAALAGFAVFTGCTAPARYHGGGQGYVKDPVCGMQVETANAPATTVHAGQRFQFCSDHCREAFEAAPERPSPRMPRWVRVLLLLGAALVVLMVVMLLTGHGPAQHMHSMSSARAGQLTTGEPASRPAAL